MSIYFHMFTQVVWKAPDGHTKQTNPYCKTVKQKLDVNTATLHSERATSVTYCTENHYHSTVCKLHY